MSSHDEVKASNAAIIEGRAPPSAHIPLDRDRIVDAALALIADHGLPGMTMRRLGGVLGVEAMSLYRYVSSKEDLLDAVVEELAAIIRRDREVLDTPRYGWEDFVERLAHDVRRVALMHPKAFPQVASRPPEATWLRPPLRSLDWVETFLAGLLNEGFTDTGAVISYRAFTSFLLGHLLLEVSTYGADVGPLDVLDNGTDDPSGLDDYPSVRRLRPGPSLDSADVEFDEALESLLDRLALIHSGSEQTAG